MRIKIGKLLQLQQWFIVKLRMFQLKFKRKENSKIKIIKTVKVRWLKLLSFLGGSGKRQSPDRLGEKIQLCRIHFLITLPCATILHRLKYNSAGQYRNKKHTLTLLELPVILASVFKFVINTMNQLEAENVEMFLVFSKTRSLPYIKVC